MFKKIDPTTYTLAPIQKISRDWMLITAGTQNGFNTMTASWGALGFLWNRPTATCYIRPNRYTFEFMEKNDVYSLCFFDEAYRPALTLLGRKSGRDSDKIKESGLTPVCDSETGAMYFEEAQEVLFLKKLYYSDLDTGTFLDDALHAANYNETNPYHRMYIGEILKLLRRI